MEAILHGLILSFGLILPLGVQNIFIFTQGVSQPNLMRAMPAVITAAICDTILIVVSIFGLSLIVLQFESLRLILMLAGAVFLLYMGWVIWRTQASTIGDNEALTVKKQIIFALSVSLLNPHALLDTVGVIGTSAVKYSGQDQVYFALACIVVSWVWFFVLAVVGAILKKLQISTSVLNIINKISALFIWGTAIYLLIGLI